MTNPNNPAALQGWVKSTDPKSGRVFYANHITRKTQWDPPEGWVDAPPPPAATQQPSVTFASIRTSKDEDEEEPLPSNWEVMHDPTTGKPFYVDHERKITTWTRPKKVDTSSSSTRMSSLQPAIATPPSSANASTALARILAQQQQQNVNTVRSYQQEALYYNSSRMTSSSSSAHGDVDLSDSLPQLQFVVQKVSDALRPNCPHCNVVFTYSKRRHHCRLCGDVFCDACSNHRVTLPLEGVEFEKPVRVCDFCQQDVDIGNFFSLRRYLTPLHLSNPHHPVSSTDDPSGVTSPESVNAALCALTQDVDQWIQTNPTLEKITIPSQILIPTVIKHLSGKNSDSTNYAIRAIASLLALESLAGQKDYAVQVWNQQPPPLDPILKILERSGSDRRTLFVQEQAARTLFYLTEPNTITAAARAAEQQPQNSGESGTNNTNTIETWDLHRAIHCCLDHASASTKNPNLQRWSAACVTHLIGEDQRRACLALNDVAAIIASGQPSPPPLSYESCLGDVTSSGGIMILTSLITADDPDTRAHAVAALATTLSSTRAVDASRIALSEMMGQPPGKSKDGDMVRAIVAGGCASSVSQLLLSAENAVAGMGCQFLASLVLPLLADPLASASLPFQYDCRYDQDGLGACREAALEIATESSLTALLSLVRENKGRTSRPIELRKIAMETLAAVALAVGEMGKAWAKGQYEEGLERYGAPAKLKDAILLLNEEGVVDGALEVLQSSAGQSLGSTSETPASRLREAAGIILASVTSCSAEAIMDLQTKQILSSVMLNSNDPSMTVQSTLRGDAAPRCLGILETVSSILMFAWQHPSGASSELLDRLIEMIDAGAIPYLSRVINSKIDWESKDKAVGAMKARTASCKVLCCLFGIALNDDTGIGMRRLMDAVDADSRSYRGGDRTPRNLIESTLAVLQTSSGLARQALLGSLSQGPHYQTALMDLVDAALLAAGSMCGSSVAPGGSEGTMVTGESFLCVRKDMYVERRTGICRVACDVVVRGGGRAGPALLPTMLVGGFGEGTVLSSLRLALAIAQNGSKEEHVKLASSGVLVPISDSLRSSLSKGDLYGFSASLAMVRFCGPHVAAGQGGGIESVRDAIRVACNVLTLPVNPEASIEQMETQDSLKSECIAALESLSRNASLWSSISTEALPSMVQFLHTTAVLKSNGSTRRQATRAAALRAVLQIVQVPSHAVSAAEAGIVEPLGKLLRSAGTASQEDPVPMLALEILHVIASNAQARRKARFLQLGLARSISVSLGKSATEEPNKPADSRADVTFLGLEILMGMLSDIEADLATEAVLQSPDASAFLDSIATEPTFVRALCATLLVSTNMKLPRHDSDQSGEVAFDIPRLYGPPLILVPEKCAGFSTTHDAAASLLFRSSVLSCAIDSKSSDEFWKSALLQGNAISDDLVECSRVAATFHAHYLALLTVDCGAFVPQDPRKKQEYVSITRPLVRYRLLENLKDLMSDLSSQTTYGSDPYVTSLLVSFNVPHICLSLWKDPAILDLAFELLKQILDQDPDEVLHLFVEGKAAIMSLFDLLNLDRSFETSNNVGEIRKFLASVLGQLAENGLLASAIEKYDVRSSAIEALAAACIAEEERPPDEDEDMTSNRLSSVLMRCLVDLCSVNDQTGSGKKRIRLSSTEAVALAKNIGSKVCHMVLSRFLERAKLQQYQIEEDEDIMDAPDVAMLCAIAQHDEALLTLRSIGGLHALSLIAGEGELSAMVALKKACKDDASVLLEGDTYVAIMGLVTDDSKGKRQLYSAAFDLLSRLCSGSAKGRQAVVEATTCHDCLLEAIHIVNSLAGVTDHTEDETESETPPEPTSDGDEDADEDGSQPSQSPPPYDAVQVTSTSTSAGVKLAPPTPEELELGIAACLFLASLVSTQLCRDTLIASERGISSVASLAESNEAPSLRYAALQLLVSLTRYSNDGDIACDFVVHVLLKVLSGDLKVPSTPELNANLMYSTAVHGAMVLFDSVSSELQEKLATLTATHFQKNAKSCSVLRSTAREHERAHAATFTFGLTTLLLLVRGKDFADQSIFTLELVTSMIHLVLWRCDSKTVVAPSDARAWDAAVSNCLLLVSLLVQRPDQQLETMGMALAHLSETTLMLARPGKAPRKAVDLLSALQQLEQGPDALAAQSAQRIRIRLF